MKSASSFRSVVAASVTDESSPLISPRIIVRSAITCILFIIPKREYTVSLGEFSWGLKSTKLESVSTQEVKAAPAPKANTNAIENILFFFIECYKLIFTPNEKLRPWANKPRSIPLDNTLLSALNSGSAPKYFVNVSRLLADPHIVIPCK